MNSPKINNKILIVSPYLTENVIQIFKQFSQMNKNLKFLGIIPSEFRKNIYSPERIDIIKTHFPSNFSLKRVKFFERKGKNPIIAPFSFLFHILKFKPRKILFFDEAFSPNLFLTGLLSKIFNIPVYFYSFENKIKKYNLLKRLIIWIVKKTIKRGFICTNTVKEVFLKNNFHPKIKKVWWGVDVEFFSKELSEEEKITIKKKLNISLNQKVIGYVGRFVEEKGIKDLIEAFEKLDLDAVLLLIGEGPLKCYLEEIAKKIDKKIIILPSQNHQNLAKYYQIMNVLVLPSKTTSFWKEQYGRVLIEAMASGTPVVGSDSGAIPEVIDDVGSIFPEGNIEKLTEAIKNEIKNYNEEKRKKLQERAKMGSIENFVKNLLDFIQKNP